MSFYVADTLGDRIAAIPHALTRHFTNLTGYTVSIHRFLNGPLGMALTPFGDILTTNGGDGFLVETSPNGSFFARRLLDSSGSPPGAGALFGLAVAPQGTGVYFVNDNTNTLNLLH